MKTYEIKISGSGTKNQIEIALMQIVQELQFSTEKEIEDRTIEDAILLTEITEE